MSFVSFSQLGRLGRLGNQMFQIAATIGCAEKYGVKAVFPKWYCHLNSRYYKLFFDCDIDESLDESSIKYRFSEPHFHYAEVPKIDGVDLFGYFQSTKYFEHCEDKIRKTFVPKTEVKERIDRVAAGLVDDFNSGCSVHVRRGDYVGNPVHDVCGLDYYNRAIEEMRGLGFTKFYVFSDDIRWVRERFGGHHVVSTGSEVEDLFLMSRFRGNIISNSSFSWWASWLNIYSDKKIIAPNRWFKDEKISDVDVYTKEMIRL